MLDTEYASFCAYIDEIAPVNKDDQGNSKRKALSEVDRQQLQRRLDRLVNQCEAFRATNAAVSNTFC